MNCALINFLDMIGHVGKEMCILGQFNNAKLDK